ncbi:MAG TPA: TonB-dependent receptor, partial [Prosthecobacter sp.]|nr:TonB-dependent receptor [Prosthecobacter sp.]
DLLHGGFGDRLEGIVGLHGFVEDFDASRLVVPPPTEFRTASSFNTGNAGIFALEKLTLGEWQVQLGGRWETQNIVDDSLAGLAPPIEVSGESLSASLGLLWSKEEVLGIKKFSVGGIISHTERLPTSTERYAFWNNAGLGRYLVGGDLDGEPLGLEKSMGYELNVTAEWSRVTFRGNAFYYDFENFIFLQEVPFFINRTVQYIERAATIWGGEAQIEWTTYQEGERKLLVTLMGDYVHGQNDTDDEPLPRMPPLRVGGRLEYSTARLILGLEARHSFAQDHLKPAPRGELPTDSYTLVGADASWKLLEGRHKVTMTLALSNILNEEARLHTSFRKDVAPLPGFGAMASVRWDF